MHFLICLLLALDDVAHPTLPKLPVIIETRTL